MRMRDQLDRFEVELLRVSPEAANELAPPAHRAALDRLQSAIAPYGIPEDVRALYEWHDGARITAFMGREFLSIDSLLQQRDFLSRLNGEPPAWLPLFYDLSGGRLFVEALQVGGDAEPFVWLKGKDYGPNLEFTSLAAMFAVLANAFASDLVTLVELENGYFAFNASDNEGFRALQRTVDPLPQGQRIHRSFFPAMDWPGSWLTAIGVDKATIALTNGPSTAISDVIAAAEHGEGTFTIAGQVVRSGSNADVLWITVRDESGLALVLVSSDQRSELLDSLERVRIEVDVEAGPTIMRPDAILEKHYGGYPLKALAIRLGEPDEE